MRWSCSTQLHLYAPAHLAAINPGAAARLQRIPRVIWGARPELGRVSFSVFPNTKTLLITSPTSRHQASAPAAGALFRLEKQISQVTALRATDPREKFTVDDARDVPGFLTRADRRRRSAYCNTLVISLGETQGQY